MEALERRKRFFAYAAILFIVFWSQCKTVEGKNSTRMSYVCPPEFIRLGHSCYFFSENKATWQNALFSCKDRDSNLTVPARWEDRNLRNYLNNPVVEKASRWIGGIYDYPSRAWKWGGELKTMRYQSFSKMKKLSPEDLQWHCIAMMPELIYRWSPRSCIEARQFICQTKLRKVPKSKLKDLRRRWHRMGDMNEITAPSVSREADSKRNDVTASQYLNPKSYDLKPGMLRKNPRNRQNVRNAKAYDLRPNELRKRSKPRPNAHRKLTRPFPGYQWNRRDPEGSFNYNSNLLRSGRLNLSPQQIKGHLARLQHLRDKHLAKSRNDDWLVNDAKAPLVETHVRTYTVDNNISALHPKTIVEEFDMMPPPSPTTVPRSARGTRW